MDGRDYLEVARELAAGVTEPHWRSAASRAYYALFLEAREALVRWGATSPPGQNVHAAVRLKLIYASEPTLKAVGRALENLIRIRNQADHQLSLPLVFASNAKAVDTISIASDRISLLDAIEADPARRAAAIAALPP